MTETPEANKFDWINLVVKMGGLIGLNQVRLRWKLMAWRESLKSSKNRAQSTAEHITYQHKICPHCSTLQDRTNKICSNCGKPLSPRFWEILKRLGFALPKVQSVSTLLTIGILICYGRTVLAQGGNPLNLDPDTLIQYGGNFPPAIMAGQWWRLSTYIFLHAGLMHIAFNLMALQQIGPQIEEIFGKPRMLFFFMLTGILAGAGSEVLGLRGVGIGASGSLMGFIGMAAGWGQKDGGRMGLAVRDMMVKWALYTVVFGVLIRADNAAHVTGFLSGALIGWISKPQWRRPKSPLADWFFGLAGAGAAIGTVLLILFPPPMTF